MKKLYTGFTRFLLIVLAFLIFDQSWAQTTITITGAGVATNGPFDIADANYVGTGDIYKGSEIGVSGTITTLEWDNFSCPVITIPTVKIYIKVIPNTTTTWTTETYATAISGLTPVYSGSYPSTANGFANPITLTTPVVFNSATSNLEIITEADYGSENDNEPSWYYNTNVANSDCSWYASSSGALPAASNSTGGIDQYRPAIRMIINTVCDTPALSLGSNPVVCSSVNAQSASLSYTATNSPTTYSISGWSGGGFANVTNATLSAGTISIAVPAGETAGTYTATLTSANSCGSVSAAYPISVTVNTSPVATASNNSPICAGQPLTLTGGPVSMTTYAWSGPSYTNGSQSPTVSNSATTGMAGTYTLVVTDGNNCTSSASTSAVINSVPAVPGSISGPASVCPSSTNTYSITAVGGATTYTWTLPSGWSGSSTTNSISATQGTGGGNITVTANNGCGNSNPQTLAVSLGSAPATPAAISGPDSVCANSTNVFSVTAVNGATSYTWTLPNGWSGSSTTSSISATQGTGVGTISVTANNSCGNSLAQTLTVTMASSAAEPGAITGVDSGCASGQNTYSVIAVSGATSYTWTLPGGWSGSSTTNSINATLGATGGNVMVTANNTCGSSTAQSIAVHIIANPATPATIIGPASSCSSIANIYSVAPVAGATSYTWTLPATWTGSSASDSISATTGNSGGTISVTANGTCGSSTAQTLLVTIGTTPATPGAISQSSSVCTNGADTFSIAPVNGATSYTWTLPNTWTGSSTTTSINATAGSGGGTVSVTANNSACGSSAAQTLSVTLASAPATPGNIVGPVTACSGSADTFAVAPVSGATSYTWTLPNGWTGTSTLEAIIAQAGSTGGTVSVTANNSCGSSTAQTLNVSMASVPATPGTITGPDSVCTPGQYTYSVQGVNGATSYTWTLPNGWSGSSTSSAINATAGSAGGNISITANNVCGSSAAQSAPVVASATPVVTFNFNQNPVCNNENTVVTLTGGTPAGGTYSGPGVTGNSFNAFGLNGGNYMFTYLYTNSAGCSASDSSIVVVTVCVGIENTTVQQIEVYPNPFNDAVIINLHGNYDKGTAMIMDATGREISRMDFEAGATSMQINTSLLARGVYLLNIITGDKPVAVRKLFKVE